MNNTTKILLITLGIMVICGLVLCCSVVFIYMFFGSISPEINELTPTPIEEIEEHVLQEKIRNLNVYPNGLFTSGYILRGESRTGFYEAELRVRVIDEEGNVLGISYVRALTGDYLPPKSEFTEFEGMIIFERGDAKKGYLQFYPHNADGNPKVMYEISVNFVN